MRKNRGQSPIQYTTVILVIVALAGSWMAYSSAGQASTEGLATESDVDKALKDTATTSDLDKAASDIISAIKGKEVTETEVTSFLSDMDWSSAKPILDAAGISYPTGVEEEKPREVPPMISEEEWNQLKSEKPGEGKTVGVVHQWLGNDWNMWLWKGTRSTLEKLGYNVELGNGKGDMSKEAGFVSDFVAKGVDGICINGGLGKAFRKAGKDAYEKGIPLACTDMTLPHAATRVFTLNTQGGVNMAWWLVQQMGGTGKIVALRYPGWDSILDRWNGAKPIFEDAGVEIVDTYQVKAKAPIQKAYDAVKATIQSHPDLKGVYAGWGLPAVGARKAVLEMGKEDQIAIVGADAPRTMLERMEEGMPAIGMLGQNPYQLGQTIAYSIHKAIEVKEETGSIDEAIDAVPKYQFGPTVMISNVNPKGMWPELKRLNPEDAWAYKFPNETPPWKE